MIPKSHIENLKLRKQSIGVERRRNMTKLVLEKGTPFPKPIEYTDIDKEFENWVKSLEMSYEGERLPIFKLFSNQRINEYAQTCQHLDESGNLLLNFLTITRENNPKKGENQGGYYNIPGNRKYPMFIIPTLEENGEEAYEMYSMKQPFCVDFVYKLNLITNKYDLLNLMNQTIHNEFKSLQCYIYPNGHSMPMELTDISDESEYSLDDRKYYSQAYTITLKGYIIRKEDYEITKLPSIAFLNNYDTPSIKRKKNVNITIEDYTEPCKCDKCNIKDEDIEKYGNMKSNVIINFPLCEFKTKFEIDENLTISDIETENVFDFSLFINGEMQTFDDEITIYNGDEISIEIERENFKKGSKITLIGYNNDTMVDMYQDKDFECEETPTEEELIKNV